MFEILIYISLISVIGVVLRMRRNKTCITELEMRNYLFGRLDKQSPKAENITVHLADCKECQALMDEMLK